MTDFLLQMLVSYRWFTWLLAFLAGFGLWFLALWAARLNKLLADWIDGKREKLRWKAAVYHVGENGDRLCPSCALEAEQATGTDHLLEDDPPEYQHPDGDEDDENWAGKLTEIASALGKMSGEDEPEERAGPPLCRDPGCEFYGWVHPPPCKPAAGPAMPPVPWSGEAASLPLHPRIRVDLSEAGFGAHDYVEDIAESAFTAAEAADVRQQIMDDLARGETIATITDGVIPTDETGRSH